MTEREALKHIKATIGAFGPDEGIELDQKAWSKLHSAIKEALAQPEQEPVAWMHIHGSHEDPCFYELTEDEISEGWTQKPLYYTAPPQRECEICGKVAKP